MGDVFLGEVVIPLVEIEDMADPDNEDVRAYTLGRRKGNEKVGNTETFLNCTCKSRACNSPLQIRTLEAVSTQCKLYATYRHLRGMKFENAWICFMGGPERC